MIFRVPEIRPISDLARNAKALIERARERQEPIVITQRGRDVAVLVPIELYRKLEARAVVRIPSVRFANPEDAKEFRMEMTIIEPPSDKPLQSRPDESDARS